MAGHAQAITELARMLELNRPRSSVDEWIENTEVEKDVKAALWLFAWAELGSSERRRTLRHPVSSRRPPLG